MVNFIHSEVRKGNPIHHRGITLTPFAWSMRIGPPRGNFGLIWNHPASVLIQTEQGEEHILPVNDVTRQIIWTIWGMALLSTFITWLVRRR